METHQPLGGGRKCRSPFYSRGRSPLDNRQLFGTGTGTDLCSVKGAQIKVARTPPSKHEAHLPLILHAIKQVEAVYILGSRVTLPLAALSDSHFV